MTPESAPSVAALAASFDCLAPDEVCRLGGITSGTLESWRKRGTGPEYIVFGNQILYPRSGLAKYLESKIRERRTTASAGLL